MGVALRNVPVINVAKDIDPQWSSALRSVFKSDWLKFKSDWLCSKLTVNKTCIKPTG